MKKVSVLFTAEVELEMEIPDTITTEWGAAMYLDKKPIPTEVMEKAEWKIESIIGKGIKNT